MSDITFTGLASGINTSDIVTKLMAAERVPVDNLSKDKETEANRLKAYGQLNTMLTDLKTSASAMNLTSNVQTTKANVSSESAVTATSDGAGTGSYEITVTQLAQVQKSISTGYASKTTSIFGTGTVTVKGKAITINSANNSLTGLMSSINAVTETTGVSASIINDGSGTTPYRLVLTGKDASTDFSVTSNLLDGLGAAIPFDSTTNITTAQTAQQAKVTIDGVSVVSNSNTISTAISGVTLNLKAISPISDSGPPIVYTTTKLDISADTSALKEKISTFVSSYNKIMDWIASGYARNIPAIETSTTTDAATRITTTTTTTTPTDAQYSHILRGDATVNTIKRGLQSILTDMVNTSGSLHILSDIGISTNQDGTLNLSDGKLDTALSNNFSGVAKLLAGEDSTDGVMKKFNTYLIKVTSASSGMYADKRNRYESKTNNLENQITQKSAILDKTESTLKARFNAMEQLVSSLNSQSSFLTQWTNSFTSSNS
ncbi:MAG: flagellar filament capping protein FliD [Pseudomonadota bacterium]